MPEAFFLITHPDGWRTVEPKPSAEALTKATSLDPGLIYQFRLDSDFDGVRHSAAFAVFNRG